MLVYNCCGVCRLGRSRTRSDLSDDHVRSVSAERNSLGEDAEDPLYMCACLVLMD